MASFLAFLMGGCFLPSESVLYEGLFNGVRYVVKAHETHTYNGSRTDWRLRLGKLPEIPINITQQWGPPVSLKGDVTTDWGVPYSDAVFGKTPFTYFTEKPAYSSIGDDYKHVDESQHYYSVLYLPREFSVADYERLATFMSSEWTAVDKALTTNTSNHFPHLVGLVLAPRSQFIHTFRGMAGGQKMVLRIDPDGYVNFDEDVDPAERNHNRHCVVEMPAKRITLHTLYTWEAYHATKAEIGKFTDNQGQSPAAYFILED